MKKYTLEEIVDTSYPIYNNYSRVLDPKKLLTILNELAEGHDNCFPKVSVGGWIPDGKWKVPVPKEPESWEERFDRKFGKESDLDVGGSYSDPDFGPKVIKTFIAQEKAASRKEVIEEIKKWGKASFWTTDEGSRVLQYDELNFSFTDILTRLEKNS